MPLIPKQLALAMTLILGATSAQYAQARGDMEPEQDTDEPLFVHRGKADAPIKPAFHRPDFRFANQAVSQNALSAARALDSTVQAALASDEVDYGTKQDIRRYLWRLNGLEPGQLGVVLEQLAGSQNANLGTATQNNMRQLNASLLSAIRQVDGDTQEGGRVWFQALGNTGKLDAQDGNDGLKQRDKGLLLGADWSIDHVWRAGAVGGKSDSDLSAKRFKGEVDSWHLGAYGVRQDGPLALRLGALYSRHAGQNKRAVDVNFLDHRENLTGSYKAQSQNIFAETGYQIDTGGLRAEPFAGVGFQRYHRDRFQEKGGHTALNVGSQTQQNLSSTFGLRLTKDFSLDNQLTLTPHLSTSWKHLYGNVDSSVRQSFAWEEIASFTEGFTIGGTSLDRNSLAMRTGLDMALSNEHSVGLTYSAEFGSNSRNQGLMGQWAMAF